MDPGKAGQSYGHVAWVESDPQVINGQNVILVSQYNYDYGAGYGMYSEMILSVNAFDHYIHVK
jgi:surface antigen